jgi:hypothetical protein
VATSKPKKGRGLADELMSDAAGSMSDDEETEEGAEYEPGSEHKAAFLDMCAAIRDGDDDAAWKAYQACQELG